MTDSAGGVSALGRIRRDIDNDFKLLESAMRQSLSGVIGKSSSKGQKMGFPKMFGKSSSQKGAASNQYRVSSTEVDSSTVSKDVASAVALIETGSFGSDTKSEIGAGADVVSTEEAEDPEPVRETLPVAEDDLPRPVNKETPESIQESEHKQISFKGSDNMGVDKGIENGEGKDLWKAGQTESVSAPVEGFGKVFDNALFMDEDPLEH